MDARTFRLLGAAIAGTVAIAAGGCGGSSDSSTGGGSAEVPGAPAPPPAVDQKVIPASAGASGPALVSYVKSLPADEDTTEPNTFAAGFTDPAEDGDEPGPAS